MIFLLGNKVLNDRFEIELAYRRYNEYEQALNNDIKQLNIDVNVYPLRLFSNDTLFHKINCLKVPVIIRQLYKLPYYIIERIGVYFIFNVLTMFFFIRRTKPEIIHINNGGYPGASSCNQLVLAGKWCGIDKIVYQVNNIAFPAKDFLAGMYDKMIGKHIKYFITASAKAKSALADNRGFDTQKIKQIPNTVIVEQVKRSRQDILKELGWDENVFLLIQVAFLTKRKGQIYLLQALNEIRKEDTSLYEKIKLILVGNGEDEHILQQYVTDNRMEGNVFMAGYRTDSVDFINASDAFVLPSVSNEDMPLVMLTAMGLGKVIISTRLAGISEAIVDAENGILVDNDPFRLTEELKRAITELYNNPDLTVKYGRNAKLIFDQRYSENAYGQQLSMLYGSLSENKVS
jgi:glycosyltransferase involved in cell wall biosynthesis